MKRMTFYHFKITIGKPIFGKGLPYKKQEKRMHKELQTLVSVYSRYIDSLKAEGADIKENHNKMSKYINEHSPIWLKGHILQDCYINCLRAYHNKPLKVSSIIKELLEKLSLIKEAEAESPSMKELLSKDEPLDVIAKLTIKTKDENGNEQIEYRNSWLPTLYTYFRPHNQEELDYMVTELEKMNDKGLISPSDFCSVRELVLNPIAKSKQFINDDNENPRKKGLNIQVINGDKILKEIEQEELELAEA